VTEILRVTELFSLIQAEYLAIDSTAKWFVGAEHIHAHDNWNRIVAVPLGGKIQLASLAAKGRDFGEAIDDVLFERRPTVEFWVWAGDFGSAESRLHALLIAVSNVVGTCNIDIANIAERWLRAELKDVTGGGAVVVLSFETPVSVVTSDESVITSGAAVGAGQPTDTVESATIVAVHQTAEGDEETIATIELTEET
jgi:hypothetical protein